MKNLIVLLITAAMLAAQYQFGLRRKKLLGAVIPAVMAALFLGISVQENTAQDIPAGLACVLALIVVWKIGFFKSQKYEKDQLDKMKTKDL